jgi:hypothetical protein
LKKNSQDSKEIPLIGQGFQAYIDNLFWFLPFSSQLQAYYMLAKKEISDEPWCTKLEELKAEHLNELRRTSGRDGKLGSQSMWPARQLVLRWLCHPQESSLWCATEPALYASAFVPELGRRWPAIAELH